MIKLYYHGGSLNHGCEAIVRSTNKILNEKTTLYSFNPQDDKKYGIDKICVLKQDSTSPISKGSIRYFQTALYTRIVKSDYLAIKYAHEEFFRDVKEKDIYLSIGGDNYCYIGIDKLGYYNKLLHKKGAKTVLWGCSVENIEDNNDLNRDLALYDLIIARESLSYLMLKKINPNTYLYPDPAFLLDAVERKLPEGFKKSNTVGINVSPLIVGYEKEQGAIFKNYSNLIDYIIEYTDMNVALIPHVFDDQNTLKDLFDLFHDTGRVTMIEDCNCMELKGYIKRCRFIITARTHVSIASYSTCVPTLVVGYSVKAKGIAKDIFGTYDNYVVPVQELDTPNTLTEKFKWLMKNEHDIKSHLEKFMPPYCEKAFKAGEKVKELL